MSFVTEIAPVLRCYDLPEDRQQTVPLGFVGGLSGAKFWQIRTPEGRFCLRRWPQAHPTPDRLKLIHSVLLRAAQQNCSFVATPLRTKTGETFVRHGGHLWELTRWIAGAADLDRPPRSERVCSAMESLAAFHSAVSSHQPWRSVGPSRGIRERLELAYWFRAEGLDALKAALCRDRLSPSLDESVRSLLETANRRIDQLIEELLPWHDRPLLLMPCIRDVHREHVLFEGDRVSGLVDFGAMRAESPAADVARLLGSYAEGDTAIWIAGIAAYEARATTHLQHDLVRLFDTATTLLAGINWAKWLYVDKRMARDLALVERRLQALQRCAENSPTSGD